MDIINASLSAAPAGHLSAKPASVEVSSAALQTSETLRSVHQMVSADLSVIERQLADGSEPDYPAIFGPLLQPKIAALIMLTRQKLLDLQQADLNSLDLTDARAELIGYVQILFHLQAAEALRLFYDFAEEHRDGQEKGLWANVGTRCLNLLARLPGEQARVLAFLHTRPHAQAQLERLSHSTNPEVAQAAQALHVVYRKWREEPAPALPVPIYVRLYRQYVQDLDANANFGLASWLIANDRVAQAVLLEDVPAILLGIQAGPSEALRWALRFAHLVMTPSAVIDLLEQALRQDGLTPQRRIVILREIGNFNQQTNDEPEGNPAYNRMLLQSAIACDSQTREVAQTAIQLLSSVQAYDALATIVEHASSRPVAERAIETLRDTRQLGLVTDLMPHRKDLQPAMRAAIKYIQNLRGMAEAVARCETEEMAQVYFSMLIANRAIEELRTLSKKTNNAGKWAKHALAEIDPSLVVPEGEKE